MRIAYADPPYPGCAHLYKDHPDYGGEVDHAELATMLLMYDGCEPDDRLDDLYPGSGAVTVAWENWRNQLRIDAA